ASAKSSPTSEVSAKRTPIRRTRGASVSRRLLLQLLAHPANERRDIDGRFRVAQTLGRDAGGEACERREAPLLAVRDDACELQDLLGDRRIQMWCGNGRAALLRSPTPALGQDVEEGVQAPHHSASFACPVPIEEQN